VSLVPERPEEVTTEGGLDVPTQGGRIEEAARRLAPAGVEVSVFLDPDPDQVEALAELARRLGEGTDDGLPIAGFEINTDAYTRAATDEDRERELDRCRRAASLGRDRGFAVYAGHGLTTANVGPIAALPEVEELNIGHWLIARAVVVGMAAAVREMLEAMESQRAL
jgi:pyridoxine 5-phosphate synthase